jgi:protein-arginine kinase
VIEKELEKSFKFEHDSQYGFITTLPNNLGSTIECQIMMSIPNVIKSRPLEFIQDMAKEYPNQSLDVNLEKQ